MAHEAGRRLAGKTILDLTWVLGGPCGKQSVAFDLKSAEGMEAFLRLMRSADAVFMASPRCPAPAGIDFDSLKAINPKMSSPSKSEK
jgi:hypothetical protein